MPGGPTEADFAIGYEEEIRKRPTIWMQIQHLCTDMTEVFILCLDN